MKWGGQVPRAEKVGVDVPIWTSEHIILITPQRKISTRQRGCNVLRKNCKIGTPLWCGASMGKNDIESLKRPSLPSSGGQPGRDESSCLFDSLSPRPAKTSSAFSNSRFFHRRFSSLMQTMSNRPFVHSLYAHSHSTTIRPLFFGHPIKPTLQAWSLFVQSFPSEQLLLCSE